jgi:hypothetical protein
MSNWSVINAPSFQTVAIGGLATAIQSARPGTVITVEEAGPPTALTLSATKAGYGVCVSLPPEQIVRVTCNSGASGLHFFGGTFAAATLPSGAPQTDNGLIVNSGASKISVHGAIFDNNQNGVQSTGGQDIWVNRCSFEVCRSDNTNFVGAQRVALTGNKMRPGARGEKFCYFGDGRAPQENISSSNCSAQGGIWEDTAHNDVMQARGDCWDVTATDNEITAFGSQGLVDFGQGTVEGRKRWLIARNTIMDAFAWGIFVQGNDLDIRDNVVLPSPEASVAPRISAGRLSPTDRIFGGRNSAPALTNPAGVDLASPTLNGDAGVVPPEFPRIILPPWAPVVQTAPDAKPLAAPTAIGTGSIRFHGGSVVTGTWLSVNRGQYTGVSGVTWEYRWLRNGVVIAGQTAQVYQVQAGDVGAEITAEHRGTNSIGTGEWTRTARVIPA